MAATRLTVGQAVVTFLGAQHVRRDGRTQRFFAGIFGIFGHGNVAGLGEALLHRPAALPYYLPRNEQAMVHTAAAFAKASNRLRAMVCTSSIGPGATNMITAAAGATINRLPVLLLPGDIFATRRPDPVLQQLEYPSSRDTSVNDCFKPISRYWDRINRPEQLPSALMEAMRVLTSPADTGTVTIALPQDVQAEAFEFADALFEPRVWEIPRARADAAALHAAASMIRRSTRPLIIAGGGVLYSEATAALRTFVEHTGIPVCETQAGKGAMPFDHPQAVGAVGATGTSAANILAREADLVIVVGSRLGDFTTASKTAFAGAHVRFISVNVTELDARKHAALPLVADAQVTLAELREALTGWRVSASYANEIASLKAAWEREVDRIYAPGNAAVISQGEVIGILNNALAPTDVVLCAAGSLPGDLHKLWRTPAPGGYHLEYGYSCMGYEIAGGLGVRMAQPDRDVYVMVGDGSYLMMAQEIVTAVQERIKLTIVVLDNHGYSSIGGLSASVGCAGFGTRYRFRGESGELDGDPVPVDFVANAASMGARAIKVCTRGEIEAALGAAKAHPGVSVIVIPVDREARVPSYESWWDVPVAATSPLDAVQRARTAYDASRKNVHDYLSASTPPRDGDPT
ncbi:MAG TPA: 3D-(3,5/4)-trihydroxycyclohexane-1,2-dione acylhydrolase (decyclizing) [Vicinamibacterales bacterium]|nr:3D-(3,5/4)-trihydroxycyclohexane-1,2-dione acylhydrolase (decyclizing) [Vicinamibacterales bacterium]